MSLNNNANSSDRRRVNVPVENDRRSGVDRRAVARNSSVFSLAQNNENDTFNRNINVEDKAFVSQNETNNSVSNPFENRNIFATQPSDTNSKNINEPQNAPRNFVLCNKKETENKILVNKTASNSNILMCAAEALPMFRRTASIEDKVDKGDYLAAAGAIGLTAINFPEDLRDISSAAEQLHCKIKGKPFVGAYDYKNFQHEFSFFRGTLLQPFIDIEKTKHPELAEKLYDWDRSLLKTRFGEKIMNLLGTENSGFEAVKSLNKSTNSWEAAKDVNGRKRFAYGFEGSRFGKLTARALARTTLIGTAVLALLELPKIINSMTKGNSIGDKVGNTANQVVKSGINVASTTAGIAYGGAIGSKYGKGLGSLIGMGVGAVLGSKASQKLQEFID